MNNTPVTRAFASMVKESIFYMDQNDFKIQIEGVTLLIKKGEN